MNTMNTMNTMDPADVPSRLPIVTVEPLEEPTSQTVLCDELQWWFVTPRLGEVTRAAWYDRDTGALTRVRQTATPVAARPDDDDSVAIEIEERERSARSQEWEPHRVGFTARLDRDRAEFLSVTTRGRTTDVSDPDFAANWAGTGIRALADANRLLGTGPGSYRSVGADGPRVDLVALTVGERVFRGLRLLDLEPGGEAHEIGQPIIDIDSGRTLAYWQYRPASWDADSATWLRDHPGVGLMIDDVPYQRRNCTGRDEVALTDHALFPRIRR